jgi:hypothetical protein
MTYPGDFYDIIEAYRAQSAFWRERHAVTDAVTAKLHSKTAEAVARSRELLRKTRPLVNDCPVLRGRPSQRPSWPSSHLIRGSTGPSLLLKAPNDLEPLLAGRYRIPILNELDGGASPWPRQR